jgi:hypothetical protein
MQLFLKLFEPYLQWFYHCFDRIVINGYLSFLTRENNVAYFFREVCRKPKITKEVLAERTSDYQDWVEQCARNHQLPLLWPEPGVRKEDLVRPRQQRMIRQNRFGVYYILKSMEQGWTFRAIPPKYATPDPNFQFLRKHKSRYTHYYFYIHDEVLRKRLYGPLSFGLFRTRPNPEHMPDSRFDKACLKVEKTMHEVIALMAA